MFVNLDMKNAFRLDALVTSHPILLPVNHPDEINEIFDSISYNKVRTTHAQRKNPLLLDKLMSRLSSMAGRFDYSDVTIFLD